MSLRDQILAAVDLKVEPLEVPEWGCTVYLKEMTGAARDRFESTFQKDRSNFRARLAALTLCDEQGNLLFTEADVKALGEKSVGALQRVWDAALKVNAFTDQDVDDLEKN